jgi:hypothetical protein
MTREAGLPPSICFALSFEEFFFFNTPLKGTMALLRQSHKEIVYGTRTLPL